MLLRSQPSVAGCTTKYSTVKCVYRISSTSSTIVNAFCGGGFELALARLQQTEKSSANVLLCLGEKTGQLGN